MGINLAAAVAAFFGGGSASMGLMNVMFATNASGQSVASGALVTVTNWTTTFDTAGAFDAPSGVYTCPNTGYYFVCAGLLFNTASAPVNSDFFCVVKAGATLQFDGEYPIQAVSIANLQTACQGFVHASAGDAIIVIARQTSGVSINLSTGNLSNSFGVAQVM
jgi:hypothetical protein